MFASKRVLKRNDKGTGIQMLLMKRLYRLVFGRYSFRISDAAPPILTEVFLILLRPQPVLYKSFPTDHSSVTLPFGPIYSRGCQSSTTYCRTKRCALLPGDPVPTPEMWLI
jgi:hypothetical protein